MFELNDATIAYNGRPVLSKVTLRIAAGERVALVGQSGAGKSSLLSQLYDVRRGEAALVPQDASLVRSLSVFHNVYMGRLHRHSGWYNLLNLARPMRREVEQVRGVVRELGGDLEAKLFTPAGELSGGQQQRTSVARSLYRGEPAILADEPVSAVDEHQARSVLEAINQSHDTVVLAMHDVALALSYTDRVIGIKDGRVVLDAPTAGLKPSDLDSVYRA